MLTERQVDRITGDVAKWFGPLTAAMEAYEITTPAREAMFLAQTAHESMDFTALVEHMNYSAIRLRQVFPKYFSEEEAEAYANNGPWIAERVYGGRMGNGPEGSGDGWRFIGRGLIHITGRSNYRECGAALGADLTASPELLELPDWAAASAAWFWWSRGLNAMADAGDYEGVTRTINGGTIGLAERQAKLASIQRAMA